MKPYLIPLDFGHHHRLIRSRKVKVPRSIEIPVYLIRCELQNRMLFKHLYDVGLGGCQLATYLDNLILITLRMWDATDETGNIYFKLIHKGSEDITLDEDVVTRRALYIYHVLVKYRDRMGIALHDHVVVQKIDRKKFRKLTQNRKG